MAKLPPSLWSALGPVSVTMVEQPKGENGEPAFGTFNMETREIEVKRGMSPGFTRQVFLHEAIHVALWDAGVRLTSDQEESVCTALASFLIVSGLVR